MATPTSRLGPHPYTRQYLHRRSLRSVTTDRQDPAVTVAAPSGSEPAAACVTIGIFDLENEGHGR